MTKIKIILISFLRYGLATVILASGITLALVSGAMTFIMYTSNYNEEDIRWIVTGGLAIAMQLQVLLLSLGFPIIQQYAPQHIKKSQILLYVSFFLSVIGSISFFTNPNDYSVGGQAIYNDVITQFVHVFFFGILDKFKNTFQTIIGIWAICFFVEFLVIFLPNLAISIFTGEYKKYINHGLSIKDLILILLFSPNRKQDLGKFINIFLKPSIEKMNAKLKEAENTKFLVENKKVIDLKPNQKKVITNEEKVITINEKGNNHNQKGSNQKEKVITMEKGLSRREQAERNHKLAKTYILDEYKAGDEVKKSKVVTKFQFTEKQWQTVLKKLQEDGTVSTKGTTTILNGANQKEKVTTCKDKKVVTTKKEAKKKEDN